MMFNFSHDVTSLATTLLEYDGLVRGFQEQLRSHPIIVLESLVLCVISIMALLGNTLVIVVIHRSRRVQSTTNYFVASIAVSDMVLVLLSSPFVCARVIMQGWLVGNVMCRLVRFVQLSSMSTISFVLVAICIDRFYTVIYPLSFKVTRGTAKRMIIAAWVTSLLVTGFCLYFFEVKRVSTAGDVVRVFCPTFIPASHWSSVIYAALCVITQFVCPLMLLVIGHSRILFYVRSVRNQVRHCSHFNAPVPRTKVKMVKMLMLLSAVNLLLYLPYYATQTVYCFGYRAFLSDDVFVASYWLISASAASKSVVYACQNSNFWRGCKEVLCMSTMKCYRFNTYIVTSASAVSKRNYVGVMDLAKEQTSFSIDSPINTRHKSIEAPQWLTIGSLPTTCL
ncbi:G-protein coupled receptor 19 [Biomphalaria pfeifferi]|uniref:G-protein coupled receptor 19 n=1 Tax=Biomphalaria pfeifferi TaxID=112525 RepID=A0AAD8BIA1_BIOPF|nr:G-protein coupled receptor 19 [Biomphalaria pfeifferi]